MDHLLIVVDRPGWAFDRIAQALKTYGEHRIPDIRIFYLKGNEKKLPEAYRNAESVFFIHWSLVLKQCKTMKWLMYGKRFENIKLKIPSYIIPEKTLVGIHSHDDWDNHESRPEKHILPPRNLVEALKKFKAVNTVSNRLFRLFTEAGLDNLTCTLNGVDTRVFRPIQPIGIFNKLRVGYTGTLKRDWNKGFSEYLSPIGKLPFVEIKSAILSPEYYVPYEKMPQFYNEIDVFLCASASEGFSLSVLEASACGRPIISTCIGGSEDLIKNGYNGFIVERNLNSFIEKLTIVNQDREMLSKIGGRNRKIVEKDFSWKIRILDWLDFIEQNR